MALERRRLFIDTWGWLTLRDRREAAHAEASRFYEDFRNNGGTIYTTDYVLDETITLLFKRLPFPLADSSLSSLEGAIGAGLLQVEWVSSERFAKAVRFRQVYGDKPNISFTDLTSMVVMRELKIKDVLTGDAHFEHVGMGFRCQP